MPSFPMPKTPIPAFLTPSAAHSAAFNPAVGASSSAVRAMNNPPEPSSQRRMFQLRLDPLSGTSQWVVIDDEEAEDNHDSNASETHSPPLLATTSYLDMLNDFLRNRAYREAIEKTLKKPCRVLDIGAGTGLLSMMAARAMGSVECASSSSEEGKVTACESYLPMLKLMRRVLCINGMQRKIDVISKRSDEVRIGVDMASRADALVSEILDSELLGEGLIPTLQHAHDMLLVENPQTVPYRATIYGQLVESAFLWKLHDLYNNESKAFDSVCLVPTGLEAILCVKPQQYAMHCDAIKEIKLLSKPFRIFEIDFWKRPDSYSETELCIRATSDGTVNAIISWWILQLDSEGTIFYSTAPKWLNLPSSTGSGNWIDHWKQCVWFIPGKGLSISRDEDVYVHCVHTDTSIAYNLKTQSSRTDVWKFDLTSRDCQLILSPERVAIYGDCEWRYLMSAAVKDAADMKERVIGFSLLQNSYEHPTPYLYDYISCFGALHGKDSPLCVVADDSLFLTILLAHLSKLSHVIALFPGLRKKGEQYLHAVADANGYSIDRVEVVGKRSILLTLHDTHQKEIDLLVGEPFYLGNEGVLPWQNLRFWKERTELDPILSKDAMIIPCKGILRACAMSLPDLWRSRCSLTKVEGFDHSVVNRTLGACGRSPIEEEGPCLPYFIWQCGETKELSKMHKVMEFDLSKPMAPCFGKAKVDFREFGICHGFVLWIDWVMDVNSNIVLSTGPDKMFWRQGVKLLADPVAVALHSSIIIEASFEPSSGQLDVKCDFTEVGSL